MKKNIYLILIIFFFIQAFFASVPTITFPGNIRFFTNKFHSMEPTISEHHLSIIKKLPAYQYMPGDTIAFNSVQSNEITSHRIIRREPAGFITKGDANEAFDKNLVPYSWVQGKVIGKIPFLGAYISVLKQPLGVFLLLVLPGLTIIINEFSVLRKLLIKKPPSKK